MTTSIFVGPGDCQERPLRKYPIIGCVLLVAAMAVLATVGADTPLWQTDIYMALFGIGLGMNMQTIQLAMQNAVEPRDIGVASSSGTFFRQLGGTLGAAVFISILFSAAPGKIASAFTAAKSTPEFQQAAAAHPDQLAKLTGGSGSLNDTSFLSSITPVLRHPFLVGFSNAMDLVFIIGSIVLVIAFVLALRVKEVPLRRMSGIQAAQAAAAKAAAADTDQPAGLASSAIGTDEPAADEVPADGAKAGA